MKAPGVYQIVNTTNGNKYIGSAINMSRRMYQHWSDLRKGCHRNSHLQRSWSKYGESAFVFRPLLVCSDKNLLFYEQICLDHLEPEYNICKHAHSVLGKKWTPEARAKMLGNRNGVGNKGNVGGKKTEAEIKAISDRMKGNKYASGHVKSEEERRKLSERMIGTQYRLGHSRTQAQKESQRKFMLGNTYALGRKHTPEEIVKMRAARLGKPGALKGRPWSEARRAAQMGITCP